MTVKDDKFLNFIISHKKRINRIYKGVVGSKSIEDSWNQWELDLE